jgi:hypothetical protein
VPFFSVLSSLQRNGGEDGVRDLMEALIRDLIYRSQPHCAVLVGEAAAAARNRTRDGVTKLTQVDHEGSPYVASQVDTITMQKAQEGFYHRVGMEAERGGVDLNTYVASTLNECQGLMDLAVAAWLHNKRGIETLILEEELVDMNGVIITSDDDDVGDDEETDSHDSEGDHAEDDMDDDNEEGEEEEEEERL